MYIADQVLAESFAALKRGDIGGCVAILSDTIQAGSRNHYKIGHQEPSDLAQETCLTLLRRLPDYQIRKRDAQGEISEQSQQDMFAQYLNKTLRGVARDTMRKLLARRLDRTDSLEPGETPPHEAALSDGLQFEQTMNRQFDEEKLQRQLDVTRQIKHAVARANPHSEKGRMASARAKGIEVFLACMDSDGSFAGQRRVLEERGLINVGAPDSTVKVTRLRARDAVSELLKVDPGTGWRR